MISGLVFDIQRFCIQDGPGIRTTVFLKGCPLDCFWCHNPESKLRNPELFYNPHFCIGCGECVRVCPNEAHTIVDGEHIFERGKCILCMKCVDPCAAGAMEMTGREMTVREVIAEVEKDAVFYGESGGGLTISGGEPFAQPEFTKSILQSARENGYHTCVETSGFAPIDKILECAPYTDLFLWDIKDTDANRHSHNTGIPLDKVIENLKTVDSHGGKTLLRCILLRDVNLNIRHLDTLADIHRGLVNSQGIELLAYHPLGSSKRQRLGLPHLDREDYEPSEEDMREARDYLMQKHGIRESD